MSEGLKGSPLPSGFACLECAHFQECSRDGKASPQQTTCVSIFYDFQLSLKRAAALKACLDETITTFQVLANLSDDDTETEIIQEQANKCLAVLHGKEEAAA